VARAERELAAGGARLLVGNGEPRLALAVAPEARAGRGGRATHLALAVARGLARLPPAARPRVAFLAAGTDDRDGDAGDDVTGAVVDGDTWTAATGAAEALARFDSATVLGAAGALVRGAGTSNLLDLHLLLVG